LPAPSILILDDDANNRLLLATLIRHAGFEPLEAGCAQEGLRLAVEESPVAAIVDLSLPDMPGAQVIRRLREDARTAGMRIALYTATRLGAAIEELTETYRIDAVIPKPGDPRETLDIIKRLAGA